MAEETGFINGVIAQGKLFLEKLNINKDILIQMGIAFGMGFLFGFLLKRWAHYVCAFILFLVGIYFLQHFGFIQITFQNPQLAELFSGDGSKSQVSLIWQWITQNAAVSLSAGIGALIGLKNA